MNKQYVKVWSIASMCALVSIFITHVGSSLVYAQVTNFGIETIESVNASSEDYKIIDVSGTVTDAETGEPIPAANVVVLGTTIGTSTNAEGEYSLNVPDDEEILQFSYLGYVTLEVPVNGRSVIDVSLEQDLLFLDDLVVVGYGTQQRQEVTGAITSVRSEEIQNIPVSSFENALQGRMAGVNVAESTGEPGASPQITIRGTGSISAGNSPLYVIDGVPITTNRNLQSDIGSQRSSFQPPSANPLATINPNDIESIEVLKDASAAAIYGSRGSNGVILITTKQGSAGRTSVNFSSYLGVSNVFNKPDMMNAEDLIQYTKESRNNNYLQEIEVGNQAANPDYNPDTNAGRPNVSHFLIPEQYVNWNGTDTDWLDLIFSPASMQNYDLSISGGMLLRHMPFQQVIWIKKVLLKDQHFNVIHFDWD